MMHTEIYCTSLDNMNYNKTIRAVHQAYLQLAAIGTRPEIDGLVYDNIPAMEALLDVLKDVGYVGVEEE